MDMYSCPFDLPTRLREPLAGYHWVAATDGMSGNRVFALRRNGKPTLFVKTAERARFSEIADEAARLDWTASLGLPCPSVVDHFVSETHAWLVTTALPGAHLAADTGLAPVIVVDIVADALALLHRLDPATCPFSNRAAGRVEVAAARAAANLVDTADFDVEWQGRHVDELLETLRRTIPHTEDLVVTHGDASLSNFIADNGRFSGFVDLGRLGIADYHQDVALAIRDICSYPGQAWVEPFLRRYGRSPDPARLAFYRLLDEFF